MKTLLAAILLTLSTSLYASDVFVQKNQGGGEIVITDKKCPITDSEPFRLAYSWVPESRVFGCWILIDDIVVILWDLPDGATQKEYKARNFVRKQTI